MVKRQGGLTTVMAVVRGRRERRGIKAFGDEGAYNTGLGGLKLGRSYIRSVEDCECGTTWAERALADEDRAREVLRGERMGEIA
jgi:hypothetical protein